MPRTSDKRERLVRSADTLILRHGFKQTTLADIAEDSGVPLGNVYYYFKSKEELGKSVIERRLEGLRELLESSADLTSPRDRLLTLLDYPLTIKDTLRLNGCPLGTLAYELSRVDGFLRDASKLLISELIDWSADRFREMGRPDAPALALQFVSNLQGMSLIANALDDADVVTTLTAQSRRWVEAL
jgi:TetR/AcrR family transcriptional repressor of nem operon